MAIPLNLVFLSTLAGSTAFVYIIIYRLLIHPLAKIPGPKLAALSRIYDFYYDCILGGKFAFKIDELHQQYGKPNQFVIVSDCQPSHPQVPLSVLVPTKSISRILSSSKNSTRSPIDSTKMLGTMLLSLHRMPHLVLPIMISIVPGGNP